MSEKSFNSEADEKEGDKKKAELYKEIYQAKILLKVHNKSNSKFDLNFPKSSFDRIIELYGHELVTPLSFILFSNPYQVETVRYSSHNINIRNTMQINNILDHLNSYYLYPASYEGLDEMEKMQKAPRLKAKYLNNIANKMKLSLSDMINYISFQMTEINVRETTRIVVSLQVYLLIFNKIHLLNVLFPEKEKFEIAFYSYRKLIKMAGIDIDKIVPYLDMIILENKKREDILKNEKSILLDKVRIRELKELIDDRLKKENIDLYVGIESCKRIPKPDVTDLEPFREEASNLLMSFMKEENQENEEEEKEEENEQQPNENNDEGEIEKPTEEEIKVTEEPEKPSEVEIEVKEEPEKQSEEENKNKEEPEKQSEEEIKVTEEPEKPSEEENKNKEEPEKPSEVEIEVKEEPEKQSEEENKNKEEQEKQSEEENKNKEEPEKPSEEEIKVTEEPEKPSEEEIKEPEKSNEQENKDINNKENENKDDNNNIKSDSEIIIKEEVKIENEKPEVNEKEENKTEEPEKNVNLESNELNIVQDDNVNDMKIKLDSKNIDEENKENEKDNNKKDNPEEDNEIKIENITLLNQEPNDDKNKENDENNSKQDNENKDKNNDGENKIEIEEIIVSSPNIENEDLNKIKIEGQSINNNNEDDPEKDKENNIMISGQTILRARNDPNKQQNKDNENSNIISGESFTKGINEPDEDLSKNKVIGQTLIIANEPKNEGINLIGGKKIIKKKIKSKNINNENEDEDVNNNMIKGQTLVIGNNDADKNKNKNDTKKEDNPVKEEMIIGKSRGLKKKFRIRRAIFLKVEK